MVGDQNEADLRRTCANQDLAVSHHGTRRRLAEETANVNEGGGQSFCQVLGNPSCGIRTVEALGAHEEGSPAGWFSATFRPKFCLPGPTSSTSCRLVLDLAYHWNTASPEDPLSAMRPDLTAGVVILGLAGHASGRIQSSTSVLSPRALTLIIAT